MIKVSDALMSFRNMVLPEPVFDFWCAELGLLSRRQAVVARAVKVVSETPNAVSIWLKPNANFVGVLPGQHVNVGIEIDGHRFQRSYSVSGVRGRCFRITANRVANGKVSSYLNQYAHRGMRFSLGEVYGDVTVNSFAQKPALFLAGGIGITPIISMLESWSQTIRHQPVQLVYWGKTTQDLAFIERLKNLAQKHSWFELKILETQFLERNADGTPRLLAETSAWFQELKGRLTDFEAFACGSDGFVDQIRERFSPLVNTFQFESFSPLLVAAEAGVPIQVRLTKQNRTVTVPSGVNLLNALERAGVAVSSGCRRGTCNTCSCNKISGITQHQGDRSINEAMASGFKPCTQSALSDISLEM
ncbi:iron-sulfur cluster-binding domain-containing protein [Reinekea sp.]|uniref:flavin reductase family protein n=1 Tax=Reinekea sp. TaxID=1970455 RepID=UPI00257B16A0|nr:iron-sulfur cluster-binding domain-containing protein [Reinekea sp.]